MHLPILRRGALLAAWSSAALRGEVSAERTMDVLQLDTPPLAFVDGGGEARTFLEALGRWRSSGIAGWYYAPVAPGDAAQLPASRGFSSRALDAGVALIAVGGRQVGLVPVLSEDTLTWACLPTDGPVRPTEETPAEAERQLLEAVGAAVDVLETLEVAAWRSEVADLLSSWQGVDPTPPGWDSRAERLCARSWRILELTHRSLSDSGGSRTAAESTTRSHVLQQLLRTARASHATAWNDGTRRALRGRAPS